MNFNITAIIHIDKLKYNFEKISDIVGKNVKIIPVIKADGYGHGMVKIAEVLSKYENVSYLGVAHTEEAVLLRKKGIEKDILVMSCIHSSDFGIMEKLGITPVIHSVELLKSAIEFAKYVGKTLSVHLKFNTGMSRLGMNEDALEYVAQLCKKEKDYINVIGVMSHFSDSESDDEWTMKQNKKFEKIIAFFENNGFEIRCKHIANTGAILKHRNTHFNCVRPGLALYGYTPFDNANNNVDLKPILDVKSQLISIHKLKKGESISYGRTFTADRDIVVGVVAFGYADGLFRNLSNKMECLVRGKRCRCVGTICMDMFMCDLSGVDAEISDEVIILGNSDNDIITADELAQKSGTINYEILTNIAKSIRVERIYKG